MGLTPRLDKLEKNLIINGNFDFWQRATSFVSTEGYLADRWSIGYASQASVFTISRQTDLPSSSSSVYSMDVDCNTLVASPVAASLCLIRHRVEGNFFKYYKNKTLYLQFWVKTNVTGTHSISMANSGESAHYPMTFNVPVADTWTKITLSFEHNDSIGTWLYNSQTGIAIVYPVIAGTNNQMSTVNQWVTSSPKFGIVGTVNLNLANNTANYVRFADFSLSDIELDSFVPAGRDYGHELQLCQRYYEKSYDIDTAPGTATILGIRGADVSGQNSEACSLMVRKRAVPTVTIWNPDTGASNSIRYRNTIGAGGAGAVNSAPVNFSAGETSFSFDGASQDNFFSMWHYTADAEL